VFCILKPLLVAFCIGSNWFEWRIEGDEMLATCSISLQAVSYITLRKGLYMVGIVELGVSTLLTIYCGSVKVEL